MQTETTITVTVQAGFLNQEFEIPYSEYLELIRKLKAMDRQMKTTPNLIRNPFKA